MAVMVAVYQDVIKDNLALIDLVEAGDAVEKGSFPCAVRSNDADNGTFGDFKIELTNCYQAAKTFGHSRCS
jgi:hypothetical protein